MAGLRLPYFDILLDEIAHGKTDIQTAFGRHVHWGYWDKEHPPTGSMKDFNDAAERMSKRVARAAGADHGQKILDVGCGFGGTVAMLNDNFDNVQLTGLNIDPRQLERARQIVPAREGNTVDFVEGDACQMPFADASFDVVLAVECAFHFPSRPKFFAEVKRVLKPGGKFALCDIIPTKRAVPLLVFQNTLFNSYFEKLAGHCDLDCTVERYRSMADDVGLRTLVEEDVTKGTLPTYSVLRHIVKKTEQHVAAGIAGTSAMEVLSRLHLLTYVIMGFDKPRRVSVADHSSPVTQPSVPVAPISSASALLSPDE